MMTTRIEMVITAQVEEAIRPISTGHSPSTGLQSPSSVH